MLNPYPFGELNSPAASHWADALVLTDIRVQTRSVVMLAFTAGFGSDYEVSK